jgi:uncharacterized membrane protein YkoI
MISAAGLGSRLVGPSQEHSTMMKIVFAAAFAAALAAPAGAQTATMAGQVRAHSAAPLSVKVDQTLASTVKISADSAYAIARAHANNGEVSSADLQMKKGKLVYEVKVLNPDKKASEVVIDAMTGEVVRAKMYGGLKSNVIHHKENKKLLDAKRDSAARNP